MSTPSIHNFTAGSVPNPLPTSDAACPDCDGQLETSWSFMGWILCQLEEETRGLVRVVCRDRECGWQGSAREVLR